MTDYQNNPAQPPNIVAAVEQPFALTPEQEHTGGLLERLLGPAISKRFLDFLQLASGATGLRVSMPLAAHAMRELESTIRDTLAGPLGARSEQNEGDERQAQVEDALTSFGFESEPIERAVKALRPRTSHADQIRKIAVQLGLAPDGDLAREWIKLQKAAGGAHKRDFHHSLVVDENFRKEFQEPFENVVRGVMVALETRFSAMTKRAEEIADMLPVSRAVTTFERELPGSPPLQLHFFSYLKSPLWLPALLERNLTGAPAHELSLGMKFRQWSIGLYLLRMAAIDDGQTPQHVVEALRTVATTENSDVRRQGMEIVAALPAAAAATASDIVLGWLTPDIRNAHLDAPQRTVKNLAEHGFVDDAIAIARAIYQLVDDDGSVATLHPMHMYEHFLAQTAVSLIGADANKSLALFSELLMTGVTIKRRDFSGGDSDYSYITPHPIASNEMRTYEPFDSLIITVRDCAIAAVNTAPEQAAAVVHALFSRGPRLFMRIALHVVAVSRDVFLSTKYLTDTSLIGQSWCEDEYAEVALATFSEISLTNQAAIFSRIEALAEEYRNSWTQRFADHEKREPNADDHRKFNDAVFREAVWKWRDVLPEEIKRRVASIVEEQGDPDNWHSRIFPPELSPLNDDDLASRPVLQIIEFLDAWRPEEGPQKQTVTALAQQVRQVIDQTPDRFVEHAERFASLRPIYVRRVLEGFEQAIQSKKVVLSGSILKLLEAVTARYARRETMGDPLVGDDSDFEWACHSAASILRHTLGQGRGGIAYEFADRVRSLIAEIIRAAPLSSKREDFEEQFERHSYFTAEQTLRGRAVELCILYVFWESKQEVSASHANQRRALELAPGIASLLDEQLQDRAQSGRIPRAVIGRWMQWLIFFGEKWLTDRLPSIFPDEDSALRHAAWRAHLLNDGGPVPDLFPQMEKLFVEEIERSRGVDDSQQKVRDDDHRENRLGEYLLVLFIGGEATNELMERFWRYGSVRALQHVIWFLGRQLQLKETDLPADKRARAIAYWEARLAAGISATDKTPYRKELGSMGGWLHPNHIDRGWMFGEIIKLLNAGFVPNPGYSVVEWLAKGSAESPVEYMRALQLVIQNARDDYFIYTTQQKEIRTILSSALATEDADAVSCALATIGYLASIGETGYQDLLPVKH